jgi:hypothetical protein
MGGGRETSGMPELARDVEKMAERAVERVKSIARGLMDKLPADVLPGMGGESEREGARAPKRAAARRAKPKKAKKAKGGAKARGKAARSAKKSARSAGSRKGKAGKGARAKSSGKRRPASRKGKK